MTVFLLFVSFLTEFSNFSEYFGIFVLWITVGKALWSQSVLLLNMAVSLGQGIFLRECHGEAMWVDRLLSIRVLQTKSLSGGETGTEWSKIVTDILPFYKHTDLEIHREKDRNKKVSLIIQHHSLAPPPLRVGLNWQEQLNRESVPDHRDIGRQLSSLYSII